jgi:hypothetical protein
MGGQSRSKGNVTVKLKSRFNKQYVNSLIRRKGNAFSQSVLYRGWLLPDSRRILEVNKRSVIVTAMNTIGKTKQKTGIEPLVGHTLALTMVGKKDRGAPSH